MCGIAGVITRRHDPAPIISAMTAALRHRGPDDEGIYLDPAAGVGLGHRRLAVLDVSSRGHQPMGSVDGRIVTVYNGEIYNFREVRAELAALGHAFHTNSDTEVLLAAYREWGLDCLARLRGMWAFALWDAPARELILVRDRLGIKPLLYADTPDGFLFASEVRALLRSGLVDNVLDRHVAWHFLSFGTVPQPATIVAGIRALPAGHVLRLRNEARRIEPYWDAVEAASGTPRPGCYGDAVAQVRHTLEEAVRYQMVADVPVGAFLSGGIDSSAIVAIASRLSDRPLRTFSIGFDSRHGHLNELGWARLAADQFGTDHTEIHMTDETVLPLLDEVVGSLDQPSIDGANTYTVSKAARRDVVVALSGLGGDELFAGYPHFRRIAAAARWAPSGFQRLRGILAAPWAQPIPGRIRSRLQLLSETPAGRLAQLRRLMDDQELGRAVSTQFRERFLPTPVTWRINDLLRSGLDVPTQVSYVELHTYLRDTLLRDADAVSMAHGLEVRPVLLDHKLVELALSLPAEYKLHNGRQKRILVDAISDLVPQAILKRRKRGFELPIVAWLSGPLRPQAFSLFESDAAREMFTPDFLEAGREAIRSGTPRAYRFWSVVVLLAYLRNEPLRLAQ